MESKGVSFSSSSEDESKFGPGNKEGLYIVEKLIGKREAVDGTPEYRVKWKGYPKNESTWEPLSNLKTCAIILAQYEGISMGKMGSREVGNPKKKNVKWQKQVAVGQTEELVSNSVLMEKEVGKCKTKTKIAATSSTTAEVGTSKVKSNATSGCSEDKEVHQETAETQGKTKAGDNDIPEILKLIKLEGQLQFFIKWAKDKIVLITAEEANVKWPQLVIAFYEKKYIQEHLLREFGDSEDDDG